MFVKTPAIRANSSISSSHAKRCAGVVRSQSRNCASLTSDQVTGQSVSVLAVIGRAFCVRFDFNQLLNVVEVFMSSGLALHFNQVVDRASSGGKSKTPASLFIDRSTTFTASFSTG
jgi:hypothetical protein